MGVMGDVVDKVHFLFGVKEKREKWGTLPLLK
jgi:hypothetical protein